jgi:hypothetical protein
VEELRVGVKDEKVALSDEEDHVCDVPDEDEPWTLVYCRKKRKKKVNF